MQPPIWKKNVNVSGFAERNRLAIEDENRRLREQENSQPMGVPKMKSGIGTVKFDIGGGVWDERDAEDLADDPVYGGVAHEALWKRDMKSARDEADSIGLELSNPSRHRLSKTERESILAEGSQLQETDPRHKELKSQLVADDEMTAMEQKQWEAKKRMQELSRMGPKGYQEYRQQQKLQSVAQASKSIAQQEADIQAKDAEGVSGRDLQAHQAAKQDILAKKQDIQQQAQSIVVPDKRVTAVTQNGVTTEYDPNTQPTPQPPSKEAVALDTVGTGGGAKAVAGQKPGVWESIKDFFNGSDQSDYLAKHGTLAKAQEAVTADLDKQTKNDPLYQEYQAGKRTIDQLPLYTKSLIEQKQKLDNAAATLGPDADRILSDTAKSVAWTANDTDRVRSLSDGEIVINPGRVFSDADNIRADIAKSGGDAEKQARANDRLNLMRESMAEKLEADLYSADNDFKAFADQWEGDKVSLIEAWSKQQKDRNWIFKAGDAIATGVEGGAIGVTGTVVGGAAGVSALVGADKMAGAIGETGAMIAGAGESVSMAGKQRGLTGGLGVTTDIANTVTQMAPMLVGGYAAQGMKPLAAAVTQGMSVYGWSAAQGYGSKLQDALAMEQEKLGRPLSEQEIAATLSRPEVQIAGFANAAQTAMLAKLLPGGSERVALEGVARKMTVADFLKKGGRAAMRDAGLKAELKQMGKTMFADATDEALEEGINQMLDGIISTAALGKDMNLGDLMEESLTASLMGGLVGGGLPQARFSKAEKTAAALVAQGEAAPTPEEQRKVDEVAGTDADVDQQVQYTKAQREIAAAEPEVAERATATLKLARGASMDELTANEVRSLGVTRDGAPLSPDVPALVEIVNGRPIVLDGAIQELEAVAPAAKGLVTMTEGEARTKSSKQPFTVTSKDGVTIQVEAKDAEEAQKIGAQQFKLGDPVETVTLAATGGANVGTSATPAPTPTGTKTAQPVADQTAIDQTVQKLRTRLGKLVNITNDPNVRVHAVPDLIEINPEALKAEAAANGLDDAQAAKWISDVVDEEVRHLAQHSAARDLYAQSGDKRDFEEWRDEHYAMVWNTEFVATGKDAMVRKLYGAGLDSLPEWKQAMEGIRMMWQRKENGNPTETAKLWTNLSAAMVEELKAVLRQLRAMVKNLTPEMKRELALLQSKLKEIENEQNNKGPAKEQSKPQAPLSVQPVPAGTAGTPEQGAKPAGTVAPSVGGNAPTPNSPTSQIPEPTSPSGLVVGQEVTGKVTSDDKGNPYFGKVVTGVVYRVGEKFILVDVDNGSGPKSRVRMAVGDVKISDKPVSQLAPQVAETPDTTTETPDAEKDKTSDIPSATLTFPSRSAAQEFATAWGRHSTRGHDMSATKKDGTTQVTIYKLSGDNKKWVDSYVAQKSAETPKSAEKPKKTAGPKKSRIGRALPRHLELFMDSGIGKALYDSGGIMSKSTALQKYGAEYMAENGSNWQDAPTITNPVFNKYIFGSKNSNRPDQVAKALFDIGVLKDGSAKELWAELGRALQSTRSVAEQEKTENAKLSQAEDFARVKDDGPYRVNVDEMSTGDKLVIDGENFTVTTVTRKDGEVAKVILEDGARFGRQTVEGGEDVWVEEFDDGTPEMTADDAAERDAADQARIPKPEPVATKPAEKVDDSKLTAENWPLESGVFEDDNLDLKVIRKRISERISAKKPIYPNRALGLEYAVFNGEVPRGLPVGQVALANLKVGEGFKLNNSDYVVEKIGKTITFRITKNGVSSTKRFDISSENKEGFLRDVDDLLMSVPHGVDAGDLVDAWERDPASTPIPRPIRMTRPMSPAPKLPATKMDVAQTNAKELFADDGGFTLAQQTTQDGDKVAKAKADAEAAKEAADKAQGKLFDLTAAEKATEKAFEGLFAAPLSESFTENIPADKIGGMINAASQLIADGVRTPEAMAAALTRIEQANGKPGALRKYSEAFWSAFRMVDTTLAKDVDWAKVYEPDKKQSDEEREMAMVMEARSIVQSPNYTTAQKYAEMVRIYDETPAFTAKTSTSKINQAYSTPMPMAYAASIMGKVTTRKRLADSAGGHAGLLIEAPANADVIVNELDPKRVARLRRSFPDWTITDEDATTLEIDGKVDGMQLNPPFGTVLLEDGSKKQFQTPFGETDQIDHAIVAHNLDNNLESDGRAVLLIGGPPPLIKSEDGRREYYGKGKRAKFFQWLNDNYNVIDHLTIDGALYKKQGAGWPIDMIVIDGKGKAKTALPSAKAPDMLSTWSELFDRSQLSDNERIANRQITEQQMRDTVRDLSAGLEGLSVGGTSATDSRPPAIPRSEQTGDEGTNRGVRPVSDDGAQNRPAADDGADQGGNTENRSDSGTSGRSDIQTGPNAGRDGKSAVKVTSFQSTYTPTAEGVVSLDTLIPSNMADPVQQALAKIQKEVGPLTAFVRRELGYRADEDISKHYAGEQIDALAAAIYNFDRGGALIVGDQTGIGKGRIAAGLMRYAVNKGLVPIFVTEKPGLLDSMMRVDLPDVGGTSIVKPAVMLSDLNKWPHARMIKLPYGKAYFESATQSGVLPEGANAIFTLYSQIQADTDKTVTKEQRAASKRNQTAPLSGWRSAALKAFGDRSVYILDESHNASGMSTTGFRMAELLQTSSRVYYSSATSAKRPENFAIYFKTNIGRITNGDMQKLTDLMQSGGVPAMQLASYMLAKDGQYLRRERSFDGITFATRIVTESAKRDAALSDNLTYALRKVVMVQNSMSQVADMINDKISKIGSKDKIPSGNRDKLETMNFASKTHNVVSQYLLAIKVASTVKESIKALSQGKKVVVGLSNTMESAIKDLAGRDGTDFTMDYKGLVMRYLDSMRTMKSGGEEFQVTAVGDPRFKDVKTEQLFNMSLIKSTDAAGEKTVTINKEVVAEITRRYMWNIYEQALNEVRTVDLGDLPLSPIDALRQAVEQAGYRTGEITGRGLGIDANGELYERSGREIDEGKINDRDAFNDEDLDFLVINQSGSTGINLHCSEKALNKKPRMMIVAQPSLDINVFMQMLGRIHRSGQVKMPEFMLLQTSLPAEYRPAAILSVKMSMLNANTTSNAKSEISEGNKAVDIFNKYGDLIAYNALERDPDLIRQLMPFEGLFKKIEGSNGGIVSFQEAQRIVEGQPDGYIARTITGYLAILPVEEQNMFWEKVLDGYLSMIDYLNEIGQNDLIAKDLDLKAKTVESKLFTQPGDGDSMFDEASTIETVETAIGKKPITGDEAVAISKSAKQSSREIAKKYQESATKLIDERIAESKAKAIKWTDEKEAKMRGDMIESRNTIARAILMLGDMGSVPREDGSFGMGVIESVKLDEERPFAPGQQLFTVMVNDGRNKVRFSAAKLTEAFKAGLPSASEWDSTTFVGSTRHIVTGNLLAALERLSGKGQVISYTTDSGETKMGLMLPAALTKSLEAEKSRTRAAKTASEILEAFDRNASVMNADKTVVIMNGDVEGSGNLTLMVPSSQKTGGKYWRNTALNAQMLGGEFRELSGRMSGTFKRENLQKVIDLLGVDFVAIDRATNDTDDTLSAAPLSDRDADYMAAVKAGDMETAQRMVDEAARAAGYDVKAYHGTNATGIKAFKKRGVATNFSNAQRLLGYFFASDQTYAAQYGSNVMPVFLKGNFSQESASAIDRIENGSESNAKQWKKRRVEKGFTGAKFGKGASEEIVVFSPSQIKSADPVVRDDNGNVIPLSQRFNPENDSILYAGNLSDRARAEMDEGAIKETMAQQKEFGNVVQPPNRASMGDETTRKVVDAFDIDFEQRREKESREQWVKQGTKKAATGRKDLIENALMNAYGEVGAVPMQPEDMIGTQIVIEQMVQEAGNNYDKLIEAGTIIQAYRKVRGDIARVLASGWDRLMPPDERNRRYLANAILTLPPTIERDISKRGYSPEKTRELIQEELRNRLTKIEKALKEYGVTINEVLGKQVYLSLNKKNIVKDIMAKNTKDEQLAIRMHQQATDVQKIAKATHMTVAEVQSLIDRVYNEALERMKVKARAGATLESLQAAALSEAEVEAEARRMVEIGLGISPTAHTTATRMMKRKAVSDSKYENDTVEAFAQRWIERLEDRNQNGVKSRKPEQFPELASLIRRHLRKRVLGFTRKVMDLGLSEEQAMQLSEEINAARKPRTKAVGVKTPPEKVNWARPEFTSGLLDYSFDTKDLDAIKQTVQALIDATAAKAKVESITDPKQRAKADALLAKLEAILAKYGTDISSVVESGKPLESYRFDITDRVHVHIVANAIRSVDADWIDKGTEYAYFSMLSGLQTLAVNASSGIHGLMDATIGRGFEMITNAVLKRPENATLGEVKYMVRAMGPILTRAKSNFMASFGAEAPFFEQDILGVPPDLEKVLEGHGMYHRTAISGQKGRLLRIPTRLLLATDEFVKTINAMAEVGAMAYRLCRASGLKPDTKEFDAKIKELVNVPGSLAWQLAAKKAYQRTFTNPLPGETDPVTGKPRPVRTAGEWVGSLVGDMQRALSKDRGSMEAKLAQTLLRLTFVPFVKIPYNITALALTYTPASLIEIAQLYARNRKAKDKMAQAEVIERLSRVMLGSTITAMLLGMGEGDDDDLEKGLLVTGSRPYNDTKKGVREAGQRLGVDAYSISWPLGNGKRGVFHYGRIEPLATILATTIDTLKEFKQSSQQKQTTGEAMGAILNGFANQLSDKTFLKGFGDFMRMAQGETDMSRFTADKIGMLVPNMIKQPLRESDPSFRDKGNSFSEELAYALFPYGQKEAKVNFYGEPSKKLGSSLTRWFDFTDAGTVATKPIDEMLWRYQQKFPNGETLPSDASPTYSVNGKQQKMTATQAAMYRKQAGQVFTARLPRLSLNYKNPTDRDIKAVQKLIDESRDIAKKILIHKPDWK